MRVLFFGTPDFATPPLRALVGEGHDVVGVVTQPDRARGRSRSQLDPSPVKVVALEEGIPVLQPERPRGEEFLDQVRALEPDISVVVAYGHILPQSLIELPPMGTLNIHASLLPQYRGAAPIQAAVRDGCAESGVTIMRMVPALDAGPVLLALATPIAADETAGELQLRLSELGAEALIEALMLLGEGQATEVAQNDALATYAKKIERDHARLDFNAPAARVSRIIRAYDPKPGAWALLRGQEVRLFGARMSDGSVGAPGEVVHAGDEGVVIACAEGAIRVLDAHPAGKRRVSAAEWVRGRGVVVGDRFE